MILKDQIKCVRQSSQGYPASLLAGLGSGTSAEFWAAGPMELLSQPKTGFFCSSKCPGRIILKTFDAITQMRDEGQILMGGFHSMMEWECLSILLRGRQLIIWVSSTKHCWNAIETGTPASLPAGATAHPVALRARQQKNDSGPRRTAQSFVAALCDRMFVAHAAANSRTAALVEEFRTKGKPIFTNIT